MQRVLGIAGLSLALCAPAPILANPYGEEEEQRHVPAAVTDIFRSRQAAERAERADRDYALMMARHHKGAVDMARLYLADPRGTNPILSRLAAAIIHNQRFEISVLEIVRQDVERGPRPTLAAGGSEFFVLRRGRHGLEHDWHFIKDAPPGALDVWLTRGMTVSDFDVQFARPMIEHHAAALTMVAEYNRNPDGGNAVIGAMNYDIAVDQKAEIDLLRRVLARYPGNLAAVPDHFPMMDVMQLSMSGMPHRH
jgi:uncharacterized protein (DUF305 family)